VRLSCGLYGVANCEWLSRKCTYRKTSLPGNISGVVSHAAAWAEPGKDDDPQNPVVETSSPTCSSNPLSARGKRPPSHIRLWAFVLTTERR